MPRKTQIANTSQLDMLDVRETLHTAPCVRPIKQEVDQWRAAGYKGVTPTTRRLLAWWFESDHRTPQGTAFRYYAAQREAIETLIYLYEVKGVRRRGDLLMAYARGQRIALPAQDDFPRYALKMATGSGKTKVMALAMAWHYFNAAHSEGDAYAKTFLLIAPNIIVLERLLNDFADGHIFKTDPIIPPEFQMLWDFNVYKRGEGERTCSEGALYVTNIQQLYEKIGPAAPLNPIVDLLGSEPPQTLQPVEGFLERIKRRGAAMVINDEAHHTNDEAKGWNEVIADLHCRLGEQNASLLSQLDFSATPRQSDGSLFSWTIYDYPLKQAILDGVVKRPVKGVSHGITEAHSDLASVRYEAYLVAAVERWQEYREELKPHNKKPILFLMLHDTKSADEVADWLRRKYPAHFDGDKLQVIHTDKSGEVSKGELEKARHAVKTVDADTNPVQCIVSVLMLREGWDVNNVTVVLGLRPFSARAQILPEQAVGRGLRKMFHGIGGGYQERVDIIGNSNFMQVVEDLEKLEGIKLDTFEYGTKKTPLVIPTISVITERIPVYDISIPRLTPRIERKKNEREIIAGLNIDQVQLKVPLSLDLTVKPATTFTYEGRDVISDDVIVTREYTIPQAQTPGEIIAFYAQIIARSLKLPSHFATLAPKIEQFLSEKAFGKHVNLDDPVALHVLNQRRELVLHLTGKVFVTLLRPLLNEDRVPVVDGATRLLSSTPPFPWSGKVADVKKTLFDLTPCGNEFELEFARFLNDASDIATFANLGNLPQKLSIEYLDSANNLRYYEPDFVARDLEGTHWLLETKGREDLDVSYKDARAERWCEDVSTLTGEMWRYLKIPQKEFSKLHPKMFVELLSGLTAGGLLFIESNVDWHTTDALSSIS